MSSRKAYRVIVTGVFGFEGVLEMRSLLEAKGGEVKPTLFSDREKSRVLSDVVIFDVKTDLEDAALRSLILRVSGVEDVTFKEADHA